jgi:hypothetical protein
MWDQVRHLPLAICASRRGFRITQAGSPELLPMRRMVTDPLPTSVVTGSV